MTTSAKPLPDLLKQAQWLQRVAFDLSVIENEAAKLEPDYTPLDPQRWGVNDALEALSEARASLDSGEPEQAEALLGQAFTMMADAFANIVSAGLEAVTKERPTSRRDAGSGEEGYEPLDGTGKVFTWASHPGLPRRGMHGA
jgi:hypothetical protein